MAFGGVATITELGNLSVRITGPTLALSTAGSIGNFGDATADIQLPTGHAALALTDLVIVNKTVAGVIVPFTVAKVAGPPIQVSVRNADAGNASGALEIYIEKQHSIVS